MTDRLGTNRQILGSVRLVCGSVTLEVGGCRAPKEEEIRKIRPKLKKTSQQGLETIQTNISMATIRATRWAGLILCLSWNDINIPYHLLCCCMIRKYRKCN